MISDTRSRMVLGARWSRDAICPVDRLGIGVLEQVSVQPGSQASHDGLIVGVLGQDDHA
jgi:hypothetical protein